jgi:hypothetical protein
VWRPQFCAAEQKIIDRLPRMPTPAHSSRAIRQRLSSM